MVKFYSPSGGEEPLARFLADEMGKLGFKVRRDAVGNVIGHFGKGRPHILLCGHMDTIASPLQVRVEDGVLYGRGAVDAKAPLAAMIVAASNLAKEGFPGSLTVACVIDEEGQSRGVKNLLKDGVEVDYAIFGEPTSVDTITTGYKGSITLRITCETETGHSSAPWLYLNSIEKTMEIWDRIKGIHFPEEKPESHFGSITSSLKKIEGGQANNIVPSRCSIQVDTRIPPGITVDRYKFTMVNLIDNYRTQNPGVRVSLEIMDETEPYIVQVKSPIVKALSHAIWSVRAKQVRLVYKTGTGDMNIYGNATGKPMVTYGPGDPHLDHTPDECIGLRDYLDGIEVLTEALRRLR
jgi:LysW-gamma-L-lysine carboxypeptidase